MKLNEADRQASMTEERLSHETVFSNARSVVHKFYQLRYLPIFEQGLKAVSLL